MPATKIFPKDTNGSPFELGLVLLPKQPVITGSGFGLEQGYISFATYNHNYPRLRPAKGTAVNALKAGDDPTKAALRQLDFLAVESCEFTRSGYGPGKALLKLLVQGAMFVNPTSADPITIPVSDWDRTKDTIQLSIPIDLDGVQVQASVTLEYYAPDISFEYMAKFRATAPRFVKRDYALNVNQSGQLAVQITDADFAVIEISRVTATATVQRLQAVVGTTVPSPVSVVIPVDVSSADWLPSVRLDISASEFKQMSAGAIYHVHETASLKLAQAIPSS
jgi:hypothetical protein